MALAAMVKGEKKVDGLEGLLHHLAAMDDNCNYSISYKRIQVNFLPSSTAIAFLLGVFTKKKSMHVLRAQY